MVGAVFLQKRACFNQRMPGSCGSLSGSCWLGPIHLPRKAKLPLSRIVCYDRRIMFPLKYRSLRLGLAFLGLLAMTPLALAGERMESRYTSTARPKAISFKVFDDVEGMSEGFEGVFAGFGGYQLVHSAGDERSWINLRSRGKTTDLYAATMKEGPGSFPRKANDVVEWRGVVDGKRFTPCAIIYRLEGNNDETRRTKTCLIVIKLDGEKSRIIGRAQGANEDAEAKAIADRACR